MERRRERNIVEPKFELKSFPNAPYAKLLTEVCPNVGIEPELQPLSGETLVLRTANRQDEARVDIRAQGFWGERKQDTYFM